MALETSMLVLCVVILLAAAPVAGAEGRTLYSFAPPFEVAPLAMRDCAATVVDADGAKALRIGTGHEQAWPGLDLPAPEGKWDLSEFESITLDVQNLSEVGVTVYCRVDNDGADGITNCVTGSINLKVSEKATLEVPLKRKLDKLPVKLFGMRGYPAGWGNDADGLDVARVTNLVIFVAQPAADYTFQIANVRAGGTYAAPEQPAVRPDDFFPFVDTFGQYKHKDWPGKTHSLEELRGRIAEEDQDLAAHIAPVSWDKWGGWNEGPARKATGFFRPEKVDGKWWLVDPDGKLFFSQGIDCVNMLDSTPVTGRESWYEDFPGNAPEFAEFIQRKAFVLHGDFAGKEPDAFCFAATNFKRKWGDDWRAKTTDRAHQRLRSWGINTVGNWSDWGMFRGQRTPYVVATGFSAREIEGSAGYWGKFKDPFDPAFLDNARRTMQGQIGVSANDPYCIGYFVDNESSWGDETSLAVATLQSPRDQPAKLAFLSDLNLKYGTIGNLNAVWGTDYASWDALQESREAPDKGLALADLQAFYTRIAEQYFATCRDAVKSVAPSNLYLGCRFAWVNPRAAEAAAKFCDVVSYNLYRHNVTDLDLPGDADVPVIIGEFHFGALDRGMFHTGLVAVKDQQARADAYTKYVESVLKHPSFVGCHWFQYQDEPTTGRYYDEENYQIGFVDTADTPYPEIVAAARALATRMYQLRASE